MIPIVETKCISTETDKVLKTLLISIQFFCMFLFKCENCSQETLGDYYMFKTHVLCSKCFDYNWKWQEKYARS